MGSRRKARECALQMLFAADFAEAVPEEVVKTYWAELGDPRLRKRRESLRRAWRRERCPSGSTR